MYNINGMHFTLNITNRIISGAIGYIACVHVVEPVTEYGV